MERANKKVNYGLIMITYLLGIFMGAIDTGIVTPARTIIQNNLLVDDKTGIWMITIYTLAYAASIPIMGKLADKFGRKYVYLASIFLFGLGSLFCGLSQAFASFPALLIARTVQAIGGGGILPVATAEFGTTFPKEKRGMALGLVGGVYGIANIFGASAGSAILDLFGKNNWQFIFYINVPITIFILIAGFLCLPNTKEVNVKKIDIWGISVLTVMVLCLLYGLKNIDFFNFGTSISSASVYPFLLVFVLLIPLFIFAETKAEDPVMNLSYFKNSKIIITLILSFITGVVMMGMIFVPQFSENAIKMPSGSGGYFVLILGLFAGLGAPVSGKLIDKFGVKVILGIGFFASIAGALYLFFVTTNYPNMLNVIICLVLIGTGIGFTMGTPLNYMMLDNTKVEESNSALATVSLVRSIGTAIAPAIMIAFIANAGANVQTNVMGLLPTEIEAPSLPYVQELSDKLDELKSNDAMKDKLSGLDMPDLSTMQKIEINMNSNSGFEMPEELVALMKDSDVTTITENCKTLAVSMFDKMTPQVISNIQNGIGSGITAMSGSVTELDSKITELQSAYDGIGQGITGMETAIASQEKALDQLKSLGKMMSSMPASAMSGDVSIVNMIPSEVKSKIPQSVLAELNDVKSVSGLNDKISGLNSAIQGLKAKVQQSKDSQAGMAQGVSSMQAAKGEMTDMLSKMTELNSAVPGAFETAKNDYLTQIDTKKADIENEFQKTLNGGFKQVYLTVAIASILALIILCFYNNKKSKDNL